MRRVIIGVGLEHSSFTLAARLLSASARIRRTQASAYPRMMFPRVSPGEWEGEFDVRRRMPFGILSQIWFPSGIDITTPEELRRNMTRVIYFRAFGLLIAYTFLILLATLARYVGLEYFLMVSGLDIIIALGLWMNLREVREQSAFLLVALTFAIGIYGSSRGGLLNTSLLYYLFAVLLASHLIGLRAMWGIAGLSVAVHTGIVLVRGSYDAAQVIGALLPIAGAFFGITLLESYVARVSNDTLDLMQSNTQALEDEIVERYGAEEALRESERRYRDAVEKASDVILTINLEGYYTFANAAAVRVSGYALEELRAMQYTTLVDPEYQGLVKQHFLRQYLARAAQTYGEYPFRTKSGKIVWLGYNVSLSVEQGAVRSFHVIGRDITERKQYEDALRRSEEQYRRLFELANDAIIIAEIDGGKILEANRRACEMYGYRRTEFIGMDVAGVVAASDTRSPEPRLVRGQGRREQYEATHRRRDGTRIEVVVNSSEIGYGGHDAVLFMSRDVTEQKRSEDALRHSQKMESLGVLAGGIAHDFNNLLQAILGQSALALSKMGPAEVAYGNIQKAEKAAIRAAELTQQLLAYSGRGRFEIRRLRMNELLEENLHLLEVSIPKRVRLAFDGGAGLWDVDADPAQMQQLVMNLIINAGEAIGDRAGHIRIRTTMETIGEGAQSWASWTQDVLLPGPYVVVEVSDDGGGMSPETMSRIFDPFFTTKFTGRGLGLAAVIGIVRGHKGGLRVTSAVGQGTTFRVALPGRPAERRAEPADDPHAERGLSGTVLVIDDEAIVREVVRDILETAGVRVLEAPDGLTGFDLMKLHRSDVSVVLLDLSMPGMSGEETLRLLKEEAPDVRVVMSSGFSETEAMEHLEGRGVSGFIQKPYKGDVLLGMLKKFL